MSGAERLREAADRIDGPWPLWEGQHATAALLRAVAARPAHDTATGTGDHATDCRLCAALDLAAAVLGTEES